MDHILPRLQDGRYAPVIDNVFPLDRISDAYDRMASNDQFGKILLDIVAE